MKIETLTIREYMEISLITETYNKEETQVEYEKKIIEYFDGSLDIPIEQSDETILSLEKTLNEEIDLVTRFTMDGIEYGFIPNLQNMTVGEYIDLDAYFKDGIRLDRIMSILYRPIINRKKRLYQIEKYKGSDELVDVMRGVDFKIAKSAMVFFSRLEKSLLNASLIFIEKAKKRMKKEKI